MAWQECCSLGSTRHASCLGKRLIRFRLSLRRRWADQITYSLGKLHERGVIWGDAKADNILIDENDEAWIINFGGSYTVGWVDKEKAGTLEGDMQGLAKTFDVLCLLYGFRTGVAVHSHLHVIR